MLDRGRASELCLSTGQHGKAFTYLIDKKADGPHRWMASSSDEAPGVAVLMK